MAKYYVQTGDIGRVLSAVDAENAALQVMDRHFDAIRWVYDDPTHSERNRRDHAACEALACFGSDFRVSEIGLGRDEAGMFETADLLDLWHGLMTAVRSITTD